VFADRSAHDRDWIRVDKELRPLFLEALETAWQRGFLCESRDLADEGFEGIAPSGAGPRMLTARLVLSRGKRLVLEIEVEDDDLDWAPGEEVEVELADGSVVKARADAATTTAAGRQGPGALLRLVLDLEAVPTGSPRSVALTGGLVLRVERAR